MDYATLTIFFKRRFIQILSTLSFLVLGCDEGEGNDEKPGPITCPTGTLKEGGNCLAPCPVGWVRSPDNRCKPPCLRGEALIDGQCRRPCPEGTVKVENVCVPDGRPDDTTCPVDLYDETGAKGVLIYVDGQAGSAEGNGTRAAPFATVHQALDALETITEPQATLLVAAGSYDISEIGIMDVEHINEIGIFGKCTAETKFVMKDRYNGLVFYTEQTDITLRGIGFERGQTPIIATKIRGLTIENCAFVDWEANFALSNVTGDSLTIRDTVFTVFDIQETTAVRTSAKEITVENSRFSVISKSGMSLLAYQPLRFTFVGNRVEGSGYGGMMLSIDGTLDQLTILRNRFDGDWVDSALAINGTQEEHGNIEISNSFIENHRPPEKTRSIALYLASVPRVTITGLEIEPGNVDAIIARDTGGLTIADTTVRGVTWSGLVVESAQNVFNQCSVSVNQSHFSGIKGYAVYHDVGHCALNLVENLFEFNRKGIWSAAKSVLVEQNSMGAIDGAAVQISQAEMVQMEGNTIASVGSAGISLMGLTGDSSTVYSMNDNAVVDCTGVGVLVRDTGGGQVMMKNNDISGTKGETIIDEEGQNTTAGDGLSLVSASDTQKTRVTLSGNSVSGNARLGVLVHGKGAEVEVTETAFGDGNGYAELVPEKKGETCDLLVQAAPILTGNDKAKAEKVTGLTVYQEIPEEEEENTDF